MFVVVLFCISSANITMTIETFHPKTYLALFASEVSYYTDCATHVALMAARFSSAIIKLGYAM